MNWVYEGQFDCLKFPNNYADALINFELKLKNVLRVVSRSLLLGDQGKTKITMEANMRRVLSAIFRSLKVLTAVE